MIEHIARSNAQISRRESVKSNIITDETPVYDLGLQKNIRGDVDRVKNFAMAYKQQYVWGKFGKSCGLTITQANDVFDTSVRQVAFDTKRIGEVILFLARNTRFAQLRTSLTRTKAV